MSWCARCFSFPVFLFFPLAVAACFRGAEKGVEGAATQELGQFSTLFRRHLTRQKHSRR